ncbi:uncharacterized protein LOC123317080 [Coccinella septempunctata]|uniref:uncharacterized protein LOC123317080 n=1 Tax=Coccinella septempunctata TaxID=41139 RepID=UPI001D088EF1|nr:uncharacterized protein LOC123317080 [Coccinella septempunctata]
MLTNALFLSSFFVFFTLLFTISEAIKCYQCSSSEDPKGQDNCGAYRKFDEREHIAIECNSFESHMPGSFCMKITHQSPKGYIWDGRWRQVMRRCASVAETGVTGVCNWGVDEDGIYWEECYCSEDRCNSSNKAISSSFGVISLILIVRWLSS